MDKHIRDLINTPGSSAANPIAVPLPGNKY